MPDADRSSIPQSAAPAPRFDSALLFPYLKKILTARVYDVAVETNLEVADRLSKRLSNTVLLKREDEQPVFSFKLRGAYNKMAHLSQAERDRGVICASAGNHAQGVALSAGRLGCRAVVVMPITTPRLKFEAVKSYGAEVILQGESYSDAYQHAVELSRSQGLTFVHPFDDPDVIAGQGTIGMEILRQWQHPIHAVFVAVGGGGLISGVAAYIKAVRPEIKVIGVQMNDSDAMLQSVREGNCITLPDVGLFSDGTAVKTVGRETFRLASQLVDEFVTVDTDAVCAAIKDVFEDTRSILEPAGAMGVAAIKQYVAQHGLQGETLVTVTCGANMNFDRLRFVAERAELGEEREALFGVSIPEQPGSFRRLCELIGERSVTEFNYRISEESAAHVLVGLAVNGRAEAQQMTGQLSSHGYEAIDLTSDELTKQHIRHMVGGRSRFSQNEHIYRVIFPERPGALMRFLAHLRPGWNISMFHYRNQGADYGRILMGIQFPADAKAEFETVMRELSYPCVEETGNDAYRLFLK